MQAPEARALLNSLLADAEKGCEVAKTAARNRKPLGGDNPYGYRFHAAVVSMSTTEGKIGPLLSGLDLTPADVDKLKRSLSTLKSTERLEQKQRADALKELRLLCHSVILPKIEGMTANPVPATEQVLPVALVQGTRRNYLVQVVVQANGTLEHQWYDACLVMIRRLVETLIIEVYEAKNKAHEIKDSSGNYRMLGDLVDHILADATFHLGRETKRGLPLIKSLGDRSAHNRYFVAKKPDIDKVIHDLRVVAEELLNLAGMR